MHIEDKSPFIRIDNSLIRVSKIDSLRARQITKPNNFGKVSDAFFAEIIVSVGADKHVFEFKTEAEQNTAFVFIEKIITTIIN